ncbi:MAG: DNA-3-methyladenine glycosylase family protein [Armatimonadota bacterium]
MLLRGVSELSARDRDLAQVIRRYGPPPLWARRPGFATLVRIILEQQVSLASAEAAYGRLQNVVGRVTPHRVMATTEGRLESAGLTRQKAAYCHALARALLAGTLNLAAIAQFTDDAVRSSLLQLPGIGPWTADIYLLMALRRADVWPQGDLALAKAAQQVKRLRRCPRSQQLSRMATAWAPWRAVAARILWHSYLSSNRR